MPAVFTQVLARRLSELTGQSFKEGEHDEIVESGKIYVAPGDYHMVLVKDEKGVKIRLNKDSLRNSVRPCANYLMESASAIYRDNLLGVVLTGMGEDGLEGARMIKENDGGVIIQDKESCVVFGMPGAIFASELYDQIFTPEEINKYFLECAL